MDARTVYVGMALIGIFSLFHILHSKQKALIQQIHEMKLAMDAIGDRNS